MRRTDLDMSEEELHLRIMHASQQSGRTIAEEISHRLACTFFADDDADRILAEMDEGDDADELAELLIQ
jgi:hypothetical protein